MPSAIQTATAFSAIPTFAAILNCGVCQNRGRHGRRGRRGEEIPASNLSLKRQTNLSKNALIFSVSSAFSAIQNPSTFQDPLRVFRVFRAFRDSDGHCVFCDSETLQHSKTPSASSASSVRSAIQTDTVPSAIQTDTAFSALSAIQTTASKLCRHNSRYKHYIPLSTRSITMKNLYQQGVLQ